MTGGRSPMLPCADCGIAGAFNGSHSLTARFDSQIGLSALTVAFWLKLAGKRSWLPCSRGLHRW